MVIGGGWGDFRAPQFRGHTPPPSPKPNVILSMTLEQRNLYKASNGENIAPNEQFNIQECISQRKSSENAIISWVFTFEHLIAYTIAFTFVI
jgi:hypothetical protein